MLIWGMRVLLKTILTLVILVVHFPALGSSQVSAVRLGIHEDKTRIVVEMVSKPQFNVLKPASDKNFQIKLLGLRFPQAYARPQKGKGHIESHYFSQSS